MGTTTKCFSTVVGGKIDRDNSIISGVSVVTEGEAKGWGLKIDKKTLETVLECAKEFSSGVKVKFRHKEAGEFQNVIDETCGVLKNFSIKGDKVIADFHLFKSLPQLSINKILEMAETIPDQFGFSIVFSGVEEERSEQKFARCEDLLSVDLCDNPAANPSGLFETKPMSKEIKYKNGKDGEHHEDCMCAKCEDASTSKKMESLTEIVNKLSEKIDKLSTPNVTALSYKDKDGKVIQLSAEEVAAALSDVGNIKKLAADGEKSAIIKNLSSENRVIFKEDGTAYKLDELKSLDIGILKFAAKNSQVLPTEAKSIYSGVGNPPEKKFTKLDKDGKEIALSGTERILKAWEGLTLNDMIRRGTTAGMTN